MSDDTNHKVTELTALTTPAAADLLHVIDDVAGTPINKKTEISDLILDFDRTQGEIDALITPVNLLFPPGDIRRYDTSALGNGTNDDTSAWVAMLAFPGRKYVPKPNSKYKVDRFDFAASDIYIFIEPGTITETNTGFGSSDSMFHFAGQSRIVFDAYGTTFQFDTKPSTDEQRHIFRVIDTSDVWFYGITAKDSGGDGWNVGLRDTPSERIYVIDCVSDNNRRNGVSITSGRDIFFINHLSKNNTGTSPQAGYDVEPNADPGTPTQTLGPLENINLVNCSALNNTGNGFQYAGGSDLTQIGPFSIAFTNCVSRGDAINFQVGGGDPSGTQEGIVEFTSCHGFDADGNGLAIKGSNMPVVWTSGMIMNPNQASNSNNRDGSAVSILSVNGTDGQDIGNISIKGLKVRDPDGNMNKTVSMQLVGEATSTYSNIDIEVDAAGVTNTKLTFMGITGPTAPISVKYLHNPTNSLTSGTGSTSTHQFAHQKIDNTGAVGGANFQINTTASQITDVFYKFEVTAAQNITLTSDAGNHFFPDNRISMQSNIIGSKLRVEWDGAVWQITDRIGTWNAITTFTSADATPSVAGGEGFITAGTTAITDFDDGVVGQTIKVSAASSITITDGSPIELLGSVNFAMVSGDTLTLHMFVDQIWRETSRTTTTASSEVVTTTNVITASENGKTFYLNTAGGFTSTLPAAAIGLNYKFIVSTVPTTAYIITTNSSANVLFGFFLDIVGEQVYFSAQDTLNFVASTSLVGDFLEVESDGTNWYCVAKSGADGGITTAAT